MERVPAVSRPTPLADKLSPSAARCRPTLADPRKVKDGPASFPRPEHLKPTLATRGPLQSHSGDVSGIPHHRPHEDTTASRALKEYRYEKLTWPEINDAIELGKVCVVPCGAVEQHGPHLPLDVDLVCPTEIARGAGRLVPDKMLVLPTVCYGYTGHVMDFPGTINNDFEHFMHHVLDITKSLAYHGFKKIVLLNGHGSNMPNLDLVARRTNLETDAECVLAAWWNLLTVDKTFLPRWRQSKFPGGCAHACELETSLYLYLDGDNVRKDRIKSGVISFNEEDSPFTWVDLFAAGPATVISWTS